MVAHLQVFDLHALRPLLNLEGLGQQVRDSDIQEVGQFEQGFQAGVGFGAFDFAHHGAVNSSFQGASFLRDKAGKFGFFMSTVVPDIGGEVFAKTLRGFGMKNRHGASVCLSGFKIHSP